MSHSILTAAKKQKNDEFYTQLTDIENEVRHYKSQFRDKVVFCNCDDPEKSNFWFFFQSKFIDYGLKRLISTHYDPVNKKSYKLEIIGDQNGDGVIDENDIIKTPLEGVGDFRDAECVELLDQSDIVCTNPPFSLFREFVALLVEHNKQFLIIGPDNAITYKEIFPLIKDNKLWLGYNKVKEFIQPDSTIKKFGNISWFTNLDVRKRHEPLILWKDYRENEFPKYDNYDAIEVAKVSNIPKDYYSVMGVPITFLTKYCPEQFEIIGGFNGYKECDYESALLCGTRTEYVDKSGKVKTWTGPTVNKKTIYFRILIKRKPTIDDMINYFINFIEDDLFTYGYDLQQIRSSLVENLYCEEEDFPDIIEWNLIGQDVIELCVADLLVGISSEIFEDDILAKKAAENAVQEFKWEYDSDGILNWERIIK